jgi:hypothetical protein
MVVASNRTTTVEPSITISQIEGSYPTGLWHQEKMADIKINEK